MGIKNLWPLLTPFCERKPINILKGKIVAIDLAGWVCESLNAVDYFIHPRHYMKNLFFRTCYLLYEDIIPVFVLEGKAPELKKHIMQVRNTIQFRGVKPRQKDDVTKKNCKDNDNLKELQNRKRFSYVLKNCEILLKSMGVLCVQAPGEAEAYCALLNKEGYVDGIISQDSDCFAYGAVTVYRNFAVSTQGQMSAQGGSVDIYDMKNICKEMDFGQDKIITLALFCGSDYNDGVAGVGKDSVLKLFNKYKNNEILERLRSWRSLDQQYSALEMKVSDKNICSNCGHFGKTVSHSKNGCLVCRKSEGCLQTVWREEKMQIKAELFLRKNALKDQNFPAQDIINEFLSHPKTPQSFTVTWEKPNIVKFIKDVGKILQWTEIYCFQKMLPILTRWQIKNVIPYKDETIFPSFIHKQKVRKGKSIFEIVWIDKNKNFEGLIPHEQYESYCIDKNIESLWTTFEPVDLIEKRYPELINLYHNFGKKQKKNNKKIAKNSKATLDMSSLIEEAVIIENQMKNTKKARKGLQLIDKFFYKNSSPVHNQLKPNLPSSTPKKKLSLNDLENDYSSDESNLSDIINCIVSKKNLLNANSIILQYEQKHYINLNRSKDDLDLLPQKRIKKNDSNNLSFKFNSLNDISVREESFLKDKFEMARYSLKKDISYFFESIELGEENDNFEKSFG